MSKKSPPRNEAATATSFLPIRIQPRASKNEIVLMEHGGIKIRLTAPPVNGAANEALAKFLSERLSIAKSRVEIVSGHTGREKVIKISGMSREAVDILLHIKKE
jgi:uncharacterized protein